MHRVEVRDLWFASAVQVFNHPGVKKTFFWQQVVHDFILGHFVLELVVLLLLVEDLVNLGHIFLSHKTDGSFDVDALLVWQSVSLDKCLRGVVSWDCCDACINAPSWVDEPEHKVGSAEWSRHRVLRGVELNWNLVQSASAHHLLNHNLGKSL
jgi:hypothetical protein